MFAKPGDTVVVCIGSYLAYSKDAGLHCLIVDPCYVVGIAISCSSKHQSNSSVRARLIYDAICNSVRTHHRRSCPTTRRLQALNCRFSRCSRISRSVCIRNIGGPVFNALNKPQ